ncbi:MAG: SRPBCC family protein [Myxococcota bacterium]
MHILWIAIAVVALLVTLVAILSALAPTKIAYTESVTVNASSADVYDDIRLQRRLMRWSAWPQETGSKCAVDTAHAEPKADGEVGARTVFYSKKGKRIGHQAIVRLEPGREVEMTLEGAGPPHSPTMTFELMPQANEQTRVHLHFENRFPRPFNAVWHFFGLSRWTRRMHVKDLEGLKAFCEPPHRDATGREVGRPPQGQNPFELTGQH